MKKGIIIVLIVLIVLSCVDDVTSTDDTLAKQTETMMSEANRQMGMPNIINFQQKKMLKMIYELCDSENLICYAYLFNEIKGEVGQFIGKCIGYGIPYSAQYSNPEKEVYRGGYNRGFGSLPQPEPNGLFMPESSSATWLIMLDKEGNPRPVYVEPLIIVSPFPLK